MTDTRGMCPYFNHETRRSIFCEGIAEHSELQVGFNSNTELINHKKLFCNGCFFRCPNATMLNKELGRYLISLCKFNSAVECVDPSKCDHCGWNSRVAQERLQLLSISNLDISRKLK